MCGGSLLPKLGTERTYALLMNFQGSRRRAPATASLNQKSISPLFTWRVRNPDLTDMSEKSPFR